MNTMDHRQFERLKEAVENVLGWGPASAWTQRDFEILSEQVEAVTQTRLSISTLKRLWRSEPSSLPQSATLDALSRFAGFDGWGGFRTQAAALSSKRYFVSYRRMFLPVVMILAVIACILLFIKYRHAGLEPGLNSVVFSSNKVVSAGVPNTVIFNYDISGTRADSAVIQQSWDSRRKETVGRKGHTHASIYYYPGFHNAKLMVGDSIVRQHNVHINTDGWQVIARSDMGGLIPVYLEIPDSDNNHILGISPKILTDSKLDMSANNYFTSYYQVKDFGDIVGDDFSLECKFKNPLGNGGLIGQYLNIVIMNERGRHIVPFSIPGCVANIGVRFNKLVLKGRENDLSALGCDMEQWNRLLLTVKNKVVVIVLNGQEVFKTVYNNPVGRIVGLHFMFFGCGAIDDVRLSDGDGRLVYSDDFEN